MNDIIVNSMHATSEHKILKICGSHMYVAIIS
jgi:hypothetical protein